jgi:hypothetical protein
MKAYSGKARLAEVWNSQRRVRHPGPGRHFCVVFDRGRYDGKLFSRLAEEKIDFITSMSARDFKVCWAQVLIDALGPWAG